MKWCPPHTCKKRAALSWLSTCRLRSDSAVGGTSKLPYFQKKCRGAFFRSGRSIAWFLLSWHRSVPATVMKGITESLHMPDASTGLIHCLTGVGDGAGGHHLCAAWESRSCQEKLSNMHSDRIQATRIPRLLVNAKGKSGFYQSFMKPLRSSPRNCTQAIINI